MKRYKSVDAYIEGEEQWQDELKRLRKILLATELEETVKWGAPCYTHDGKNLVGLGAFKSYVGLWFFQGALLTDPKNVLINAQEGKTKAMRQWRFPTKRDINAQVIKSYVKEAIALNKTGKAIQPDRGKPIELPPQLAKALSKSKKTQSSFDAFTIGKQREFAEYIASAKREETKTKRLEKILPMILEGVGLNDQYR